MLVDVFQVGIDDFTAMIGMVDLDTVKRNLSTHLVKQSRVIESEAMLAAAWMGNKAHGPTAMGRIYRLCHIGHDGTETSLANHSESSLPIGSVSMLAQEPAIVRGSTQFPAILR